MGCTQSRIDHEESVSRCKERKILMKEALAARNLFAAAHSGYAVALKNTGMALTSYAQGETQIPDPIIPHVGTGGTTTSLPTGTKPPPPLEDPLPPPSPPQDPLPPPPPLPSFSPSPLLLRSTTMPDFPVSKRGVSKMESISIPEDADFEEEIRHGKENGVDAKEWNLIRKKNGKAVRNSGEDVVVGNNNNHHMDDGVAKPSPSPPRAPPMAPPPPPDLKGAAWDYFFDVDTMGRPSLDDNYEIKEDEEEEEEGEEDDDDEMGSESTDGYGDLGVRRGNGGMEFKTPEKVGGMDFKTPEKVRGMKAVEEEEDEVETPVTPPAIRQFVHANTAPPDVNAIRFPKPGNGVDLVKVIEDIDEYFLKAEASALEVSKMLEANRFQYHCNFADNKAPIDHAAMVMRVITWNKAASNGPAENYEDNETHAIVLDKLLAWEKKLYDEVKAGELMKLEYQRKVKALNRQKKRGAGAESLEKTKAAVSHLHTRYIVDMQSMDSTVAEVNDLRDRQLYPKLVELVHGMAKMWESMLSYHHSQLKIVMDLRSLDISLTPKETSIGHHTQTRELLSVIERWKTEFEKLVTHQKQYIKTLNSWLKLNLIPIESSLKEKPSSPLRIQNPPVQSLLHNWCDYLDKLPEELPRTAITSFAAVINGIINHQEEEMKLKDRYEETKKEHMRKSQAFEDWYHRHRRKSQAFDELDPDIGGVMNGKDPVSERRFVVESLKKRMEEEKEEYDKHCLQVREKSVGGLKTRLPELFRAMADFAHCSAQAYGELISIIQSQKVNG